MWLILNSLAVWFGYLLWRSAAQSQKNPSWPSILVSTEANAKVFLGESTITHNSAASLESFWSPRVVCCFVHIFSLTICHPTSEAMLWGRSHWRVWWCEPNGPHRCGWQSPWHRIKGCIGLGLRIGNPTFKVCFASPNYATAVPFDPNVYLLDQKSESTSQRQRKPENPSRSQNKMGKCPKMRDSSKSPIWRESFLSGRLRP